MAPAPAALPPTVGTREVAPASKDDTAEETLGASVPDGPTAETCERSDESAGRTELGKFEAWEANEDRAEPAAPAAFVGTAELTGRLDT